MSSKTELKSQDILKYINECVQTKGYPPTVREIGQAVGLKSSSTVFAYLLKLEKEGYIRRDPSKTRAIILNSEHSTSPSPESINLPVIGSVAAGVPIFAEQNIEDYIPIPAEMVGHGKHFILKVRGDSMIDDGIFNGDLLIVKEQTTANNGEIVVALVDDEATVKRIYLSSDKIELRPANTAYEPIFVRQAHIAGKVTGLFRRLN